MYAHLLEAVGVDGRFPQYMKKNHKRVSPILRHFLFLFYLIPKKTKIAYTNGRTNVEGKLFCVGVYIVSSCRFRHPGIFDLVVLDSQEVLRECSGQERTCFVPRGILWVLFRIFAGIQQGRSGASCKVPWAQDCDIQA
jgi:hypothetical protein